LAKVKYTAPTHKKREKSCMVHFLNTIILPNLYFLALDIRGLVTVNSS
jgi:hypothetical protein